MPTMNDPSGLSADGFIGEVIAHAHLPGADIHVVKYSEDAYAVMSRETAHHLSGAFALAGDLCRSLYNITIEEAAVDDPVGRGWANAADKFYRRAKKAAREWVNEVFGGTKKTIG